MACCSVVVIGEIGPDRCDSHGGAVPHRALTSKSCARRFTPRLALRDGCQDIVSARSIAAIGILFVAAGEGCSEIVLIDPAMPREHFENAEGHFRVVRVLPRTGRDSPKHRSLGPTLAVKERHPE